MTRRYKTEPDMEQVRRRLYSIVMRGEDRDSVNAARLLLREDGMDEAGPDAILLDQINEALKQPL